MRLLRDPGAVVLRGVPVTPGDATFRELAAALGPVGAEDAVDLREVRATDAPRRDKRGWMVLSSTSEEIPCHTDEYFDDSPSEAIALHCITPAAEGGDSLIAYLRDVTALLSPDERSVLATPAFPTPNGPRPILTTEKGAPAIRLNENVLHAMVAKGMPLEPEAAAALASLKRAILAVQHVVTLAAGDCLLTNNFTTLHGRTAFAEDSARRLVRIRIGDLRSG